MDSSQSKIDLKHIVNKDGYLKLDRCRILPAGDHCIDDLSSLKVLRFVASGSFGSCIECRGLNGRSYAIKIIVSPQDALLRNHAQKNAQHEIDVHTGPRFSGLPQGSVFVRLLAYGNLPANLGKTLGLDIGKVLIYEWCNAGDLDCVLDEIMQTEYFLPEGLIWKWLLELVTACIHMSKMCIIDRKQYPAILHDDISLSNIFLAYREDDPSGTRSWPSIRIGDFGLAFALPLSEEVVESETMRPIFAAPGWPGKSVKSELWSFMHLIYLMCTHMCPARPRDVPDGNPDNNPFDNVNKYSKEMMDAFNEEVEVWRIPDFYSDDLQEFFEWVLDEDYILRPTPLEAMNRLEEMQAVQRTTRFVPVPDGIFMDFEQRRALQRSRVGL